MNYFKLLRELFLRHASTKDVLSKVKLIEMEQPDAAVEI